MIVISQQQKNMDYEFNQTNQINLNTHKTEILMLAILHVSAWCCLIRPDYNFVFLFFAYFYIVTRKDTISINIVLYRITKIFGLVIMLLVMDVIFFIFVPSSWMAEQQNNFVWNHQRGMHGFAIFLSIVIFLLKIPLLYLMNQHRKMVNEKQ